MILKGSKNLSILKYKEFLKSNYYLESNHFNQVRSN